MTFDRKRLVKKPKEIKTIFTSNGRENERQNKKNELEPKKNFQDRMSFWGYTFTILAFGAGIGALFGGFAYSLTATTDEKLKEDVAYYKEQRNLATNESDSLKSDNELLKSEKESLQEQLSSKQKENKSLNDELTQYRDEESKNGKDAIDSNSTDGNISKVEADGEMSSEQKVITLNESVSFFKGKINVATTYIYNSSTDIQVGTDGYDSEIFTSNAVGTQINYESDSKYQVRIIKIDYDDENIEVQVTKF